MNRPPVDEERFDLIVSPRIEGPWAVVDVKGEVDLYTSPRLREAVHRLVAQGHHQVILDLSGVSFLDSSGLGVLVGALKRLRQRDGVLLLAEPQNAVQRVLAITGLEALLPTYDTLEDAMQIPAGAEGKR